MKTFGFRFSGSFAALAVASALALPQAASAALQLTAAGIADGFTLTTVTTMPQNGPFGAWGSAILGNGNLVVNGYDVANIGRTVNYVFKDVDNQTPADALFKSGWNDGNYASALAALNGVVYGTHYSDNTTRIVNIDGSEGAIVSNVGRGGIGADKARNSLLVATDAGVEEIDLSNPDPSTNHRVVVSAPGSQVDGVTVSPDGQTVYAELNGSIVGYTIATGVKVYDSGGIGGADGVGVISGGALDGDLIVNSNFGFVALIDVATNAISQIATGGSRGDYVGFDTSNGTLFLSQGDSLLRLALAGSVIGGGGGGGTGVPEPAGWALLLPAFAAALAASQRRPRR